MKKIVLVGGTGTLGKALIKRFYHDHEIVVFSRDEFKQQALKKKYPKVEFVLGDIREPIPSKVFRGAETVYHVAALKHVDVLEDNVEQSVKTNILGTFNSLEAAEEACVGNFVFTSTDKAVLPINVYGQSKAVAERMTLNRNRTSGYTHFHVFRWGNVIGSRGSVLDYFTKTLVEEGKIYLTHPDMTRFWMTIDDAINFMVNNLNHISDKAKYPEMKAASVLDLIKALADYHKIREFKIVETGLRPGEKIHECMDREINLTSENTPNRWTRSELLELISCVE